MLKHIRLANHFQKENSKNLNFLLMLGTAKVERYRALVAVREVRGLNRVLGILFQRRNLKLITNQSCMAKMDALSRIN